MTQRTLIPSPAQAHDSPWYRKAFGAGYLDLYAHRDRADAARAVNFLRDHLNLNQGRLLDLCCGPGRHLSLLAPYLERSIGLDLSRVLLGQARDHCSATLETRPDGDRHHFALVEGDMRKLPFAAGSFDVVINLFTSFGYFDNDAENLAVLDDIARVLAPSGVFVLDHINRSHLESYLELDSRKQLKNGTTVVEKRDFDPATRRVSKHVVWREPDGECMEWTESVRVYNAAELREILQERGLHVYAEFGDFEGAPLRKDSSRMILLARGQAEPKGNQSMYVVCVTSWIKAEHRQEYEKACRENGVATREEPGNLRFDLLQHAENPNQFFFYEVYRTEQDFHRHHETAHYLKWRDTVTPWMEKPREGVKYHSLLPVEEHQW